MLMLTKVYVLAARLGYLEADAIAGLLRDAVTVAAWLA